MKGYGEYKKTTYDWLPSIPAHWEWLYLSQVSKEQCRKNVDNAEKNILSLSYGNIIRKKNVDFGLSPKDYATYQIVSNGNIILRLTDLQNDKKSLRTGLVKEQGIITSAYVCLVTQHNSNFLHYLLHSYDSVKLFYGLGGGVRQSIGFKDIRGLQIPLPPREEQDQIVRYLDAKTGKINKLIRIKQQQIALLKEKKQAIINQAVTRGLDPNAPMKDSGIAWIGQIPDGWTVERLKFLMGKIVDCPHETPHYFADGTYFVIRTADQDYGFLRDTDQMYRLESQEYQQRIRRERLLKDDIVYGREGERWGLACLVPESDMFCLGQRMMQFRCNSSKIIPQFAVWMLNAQYIYRQGTLDTLGSTSPHVNIATIKNYYCILPSIEVQESISRFVNEVSCGAENLIKNMESKIAALTEYRTRLISDVVTGKVDVRNIRIDDSPLAVLEEEYDEEADDTTDALECEE